MRVDIQSDFFSWRRPAKMIYDLTNNEVHH